MPDQPRELYREFTNWAGWVYAVLWAGVGIPALLSWSTISIFLLAGGGLLQILVGGLLVTVETDGVRVGLGRVRLFGTFIPFSDVTRVEPVTYRPLREFGGWGFRGNREKRAWTARGNRALLIHTQDGREVYIGSDDPRTLDTRVRNAMSLSGYALDADDRP